MPPVTVARVAPPRHKPIVIKKKKVQRAASRRNSPMASAYKRKTLEFFDNEKFQKCNIILGYKEPRPSKNKSREKVLFSVHLLSS